MNPNTPIADKNLFFLTGNILPPSGDSTDATAQVPANTTSGGDAVARDPGHGTVWFRPLAGGIQQVAHEALPPGMFSAALPVTGSAAPYPPPDCVEQALGLAPKQRLAQARACVQTLKATLGRPEQRAASEKLIDQMAACLIGLDCTGLSIMSGQLPGLQNMRAGSANPGLRTQFVAYLDSLEQGMTALEQVNPMLAAIDTRNPGELRAFLAHHLDAFSHAMDAGNSGRALELVSAMEEEAWQHDPDQSAYPGVFEAIAGLTSHVWARTLEPGHVDAVRRALGELPVVVVPHVMAPRLPDDVDLTGFHPGTAAVQDCPVEVQPSTGSLILDAREFLDTLFKTDDGKKPKYSLVHQKLMAKFSVSSDIAGCLYTAAKNKQRLYDGLPALGRNITESTPVDESTLGVEKDARILKGLLRYQEAEAAKNGRPIAAPTHAQLSQLAGGHQRRALHWMRILWHSGSATNKPVGDHVSAIEDALSDAGAFEEHGVYMPVRNLLKGNPQENIKTMAALNRNANYYKTRDNQNFSANGELTRRTNPKAPATIEHEMMAMLQNQPMDTVVDRNFFVSLGYPPDYIGRRLHQLCLLGQLTRTGDLYSLAPKAFIVGKDPTISRGRPRNAAAPARDPQELHEPKAKMRRIDSAGPTANPTGALKTGRQAIDGVPAGLLIRPDGLPSDLAVQYAANVARTPGYFNTDLGDLHTHALVTAIARDYKVNISILRDNPAYALLANRPAPVLYPAPGGAARPVIRLRNAVVVNAASHDTAHYEFAVDGVHTDWQPTWPDGDCLYESVGRALQAAGLEPEVLSVGVLRDYVAREIENDPEGYRSWITVDGMDDLRMLSAGRP